MSKLNAPLAMLRHHVTGAIERGEAVAIVEMPARKPIRYEVRNRITGKVSTFKTSRAASAACDRMDNEYGAVICSRSAIWED